MPQSVRDGHIPDNLAELLQARANDNGFKGYTFLPDDDAREVHLSFAELDRRARAVAAVLQEQGRAGQRALLCYPPGVDFLVGLFGCFYAGTIVVPVYPPRARRVDPRLESIFADCEPALLLTGTEVFHNAERLTAPMPRLRDLAWLDTASVPSEAAAGWRAPSLGRNDLAVLQYTSGSTGSPKGVMLTHGCLLHNLTRMSEVLGLSADTDGVSWLPAFHDMGLIGNFLQAVHCGGSLTFLSPAAFAHDPLLWLRTISARGAYISGGPCFAFQHCVSRLTPENAQGLALDCWRVAYIGAEPIVPAVLDRFAEAFAPHGFRREAFFPCYGLAEATLMVTGTKLEARPHGRGSLVGCGKALGDLEVAVIDQTGEPLPEGHIGEIWVAGPSVAQGYWGQPDESARVFQARRADRPETAYLRTGDLGFLHEGELYVSGRAKDLIIVRGRNYYPQDLESIVAQVCPQLPPHAAAFATDDGRVVIVQEVPRGFQTGLGAERFDRIRQAIAEQHELEVHALVLVKTGSIPKSSSGKVRRQECARQFQAGELSIVEEINCVTPTSRDLGEAQPKPLPHGRGSLEEKKVRSWLIDRLAQRLNLRPEQIDVDRPFVAFGLDSLALVTMAADLQQWLGRRLSPTLLYRAPTVALLAEAIAGTAEPPAEIAIPTETGPIAVIGIGCRFPQADGPEQFWQLLCDGRCVVGESPTDRCQGSGLGGYLASVDQFDAAFFGINPVEAACIDPQHRLLLEVAWHALEHAGLPPDRLAGRAVGTFVGISSNDYGRLLLSEAGYTGPYLGIGNSPSMAAHRLAYHLDFRGPSVAVDTACSSSLVAVHQACQALRNGECELALAGGVNLILVPEVTETLTQAGMLSPTGRCRTFDASADGYVRGEGCGLIVLKPLAAALRDGDRIFAVLEASAVNQDGRSNGITAPNGAAQTELIRRVLRLAERSPAEVGCIEAHGTGTPLGDPIEFDALVEALTPSPPVGEGWGGGRHCNDITPTPTLPHPGGGRRIALSSVKTNLGHLEAAAGIAGLIKAVLQIHHGQIVPHLHLHQVNPHIQLEESRFRIPRTVEAWPEPNRPRVGGVSSFGFGGTNAHVLVCQAPPTDRDRREAGGGRPLQLLPLSAQSGEALRELASRYAEWLDQNPGVPLADVCAAASQGRGHFRHRLAIHGDDVRKIAAELRAFAKGSDRQGAMENRSLTVAAPPTVAFLFTGQGSQYAGMARRLQQTCRPFRDALGRCENILANHAIALREVLGDADRLEWTDIAQPALFAVEYALAETWRQWGVQPAAVLGHSLGEYVAACVAGVLSLEDGLSLVVERGRLMQQCPPGAMLACFAPLDRIREHLDRWDDELAVAAINGPENILVSGPPGTTAAFREQLAADGIESRWLRSAHAFHSPLIESSLSGLLKAAKSIDWRTPAIPLVSNRTGQFHESPPTPDYWVEHARFTVQFAAGMETLRQMGITHFLEIGPNAVLSRLGAGCVKDAVFLASLRRNEDDWSTMLESLGRLYVAGARIDWDGFDDRVRRPFLDLPNYPFQRQRYWIDGVRNVGQVSNLPHTGKLETCPTTGWGRLPAGLQGTLLPIAQEELTRHAVEQFAAVRKEFDYLAGVYVVEIFRHLGWSPLAGERIEEDTLVRRLGVIEPYRRLLGRLLEMADEDGWLARSGNGWQVVEFPPLSHGHVSFEEVQARFPAFAADLQLAHRCAERMPAVLRGEQDPVQVLFDDEGAKLIEHLYEQSPIARLSNELVARSLEKLVAEAAGRRPVRILEIGAGTGGTTAHLLPMLSGRPVEYFFTDISRLFLMQAHEKFRAFPFLKYRLFDLEQEPAFQGFDDGEFDIIVAANVFHATSNLQHCCRAVHRLLAPNGILLLLEGTGPRRLLDFIFGLTPGWWKFADSAVRPDYPLVAPGQWLQMLGEEGFVESVVLPDAKERWPDPDQVVIVARAAATVTPATSRDRQGAEGPQSLGREALQAAPPEERRSLVESLLRHEFAAVLGRSLSAADLDRSLQTFGLDSLIAIQLRNRIETRLGVSLSIVELLKGTTLRRIIDDSLAQFEAGDSPREKAAPLPEINAEQVEQLSDAQLENALQTLLR